MAIDPTDVMIIDDGLNMHSVCKNKEGNCPAFGRAIRIRKGFNEKFNIGKESRSCKCPKCG